eukprot:jgi/Bigna1/61870/fgenesh1_kg.27_\
MNKAQKFNANDLSIMHIVMPMSLCLSRVGALSTPEFNHCMLKATRLTHATRNCELCALAFIFRCVS